MHSMCAPRVTRQMSRRYSHWKLSEDFAKPYFHKYWTEIHYVTTIWKRNVCGFIVTLNAFDVRPHVWHGRCPGDTPIPAKPSQACLVWRSRLRCWCALAILVVSLEVVGRKHCLWRNPTGRNHTLSGFAKSSDNLYAPCKLKPYTLWLIIQNDTNLY